MSQAITTEETGAAWARCVAELNAREAELEALEEKARDLIKECARDQASTEKRAALTALRKEIDHVEDDVEILREAEKIAQHDHDAAVRAEKMVRFRELAKKADVTHALFVIGKTYVDVVRAARTELETAERGMAAIVHVQRRDQSELEELARELGIAAPGFKLDLEATRLTANRAIAYLPDVSRLLTPINEVDSYVGGHKQTHWLLNRNTAGADFARADNYLDAVKQAIVNAEKNDE